MTAEEYAIAKKREKAEAEALVESIRGSSDPHVRYRDVRPITDIRDMLTSSAERYAGHVAFSVKDSRDAPYRPISYRETKETVDALGTMLTAAGFAGKRVALIGENGYPWAVSYLAVVCGVGVVVPLDKELNDDELEQLILASEAECVLFTKKYRHTFVRIRDAGESNLKLLIDLTGTERADDVRLLADCVEEGGRLLAAGNRDFLDARILNTEMCALLYTSGTTGVAKGVMLSQKNLVTGIVVPPTVLNIVETDVFFSVLPMHHCYECTCGFLIPLYRGASVAFCEGLKYIVKNLAEARPTVMLTVPLILENLYGKIWSTAKKSGKDGALKSLMRVSAVTRKFGLKLAPLLFRQIHALLGGRMRVLICGGAAVDPQVLAGFRDFGLVAVQGYGLTECSPICALNPDTAPKDESAGYLVPGFDGKIIDADPGLGIGEICVRGDHVMLGYHREPDATAAVLRDGWFHTGDIGYIDPDRYVHITGRKKNVIITKNGKNVFPEELEYRLNRLDIVEACMVWGGPGDTPGDIVIVASVKPNGEAVRALLGDDCTDERIKRLLWRDVDAINEDLAPFKRIRRIILRREDFEMTTGKKIKRFVEANKEK